MKKILLPSVTLLAALVLVGCSSTSGETSKMQQSSENLKVKSSSSSEEADTAMELWEKLADNSKSVEEIYVTGDITVGENQEVKAGIYDLQVTGGSGNISVEHGIYIPGFTSNYVTFSPFRSAGAKQINHPLCGCASLVIPKKLQTRYNKGVQA